MELYFANKIELRRIKGK